MAAFITFMDVEGAFLEVCLAGMIIGFLIAQLLMKQKLP